MCPYIYICAIATGYAMPSSRAADNQSLLESPLARARGQAIMKPPRNDRVVRNGSFEP